MPCEVRVVLFISPPLRRERILRNNETQHPPHREELQQGQNVCENPGRARLNVELIQHSRK